MRFLFAFTIFTLSSVGFASDEWSWYVLKSYTCTLSNGVTVSYDKTKDLNHVSSNLGAVAKTFYVDRTFYDQDANLSLIEFTGHQPSAGPALDPWESAYSVRIAGPLPVGVSTKVEAQIYKNPSFLGWVLMPLSVKCDVLVERTF